MSILKIENLSGINKTIAIMCDAKENGGNANKAINAGREKGLYESAVESILGNTFIFKGRTYNGDGSVFEKETAEQNNNQNTFNFTETASSQVVSGFNKGNYTSVGTANGFSNAYDDKILQYANKYGINPNYVKATIAVESGFNANAVSSTNDYGLMQLNARYNGKVLNVDENLDKGCKYLAQCLKEFNGDMNKASMGYNMGIYGAKKSGADSTSYSRKVVANYNSLKNNQKFSITA